MDSRNWRCAILKGVGALSIALSLQACGSDGPIASGTCLPPPVASLFDAKEKDPSPAELKVYLDGSESMAGYVSDSNIKTLGNIISEIKTIKSDIHAKSVVVVPFGTVIGPPIGDPERYAQPSAYQCHACDNQYTYLNIPFEEIVRDTEARQSKSGSTSTGLAMIVTDMWPDNPRAINDLDINLGNPIRKLLQSGSAIGLLGIPTLFGGDVFFEDGRAKVPKAKRLLVVALIGRQKDVETAYDVISVKGTREMNFALFSAGTSKFQFRAPSSTSGVRNGDFGEDISPRLGPLTKLRFDGAGSIDLTLDPQQAMKPHEVGPRTPEKAAYIWKMSDQSGDILQCSSSAWKRMGSLPLKGWSGTRDGKVLYRFDKSVLSKAGVEAGQTYLIQAYAGGKRGAFTDRDTSPATWMEEWGSVGRTRREVLGGSAGAKIIRTPSLPLVRKIMIDAVAHINEKQKWRSSGGYVVKIASAASN